MLCKICGDVENHRSKMTLFEGIGAIRKDYEMRRLIAIDLSYNDISLPRMEICESVRGVRAQSARISIMSLTSTLTTLSKYLNNYIIQSTYSYRSNTRKDLECEYLTRASRSNTGTVQQLKERFGHVEKRMILS